MSKNKIEKWLEGFPDRFKDVFDFAINAEIARRLKKKDAVIKNYSEGRIPAPEILVQISLATNCSIHWLLTGEGPKYLTKPEEVLPPLSASEINAVNKLAKENNRNVADEMRELILAQLIAKGLISDQVEKGITLEFYGGMIEVSLLGEIAAGEPLHVFRQNEKVQIVKTFEFEDREVFALRVRGESMLEDDIHDGDLIICVRAHSARDGDRVVALIDGDKATVKRYYKENGKVRLQPANSDHNPIILDAKRVEIQGIVRGVQRRS